MNTLPRKTKRNNITSPELIAKINPKNTRLMSDFFAYLNSIKRSDNTISSYKNDLEIFFVWNLLNNDNKFFIEITKREFVGYQNWLITENENSPARIRRLKSTISSISNYIENILDDEFDYRSIIKKIESPANEIVREKTILSEEKLDSLLDHLVENKKYQQACCLALCMCSGVRKSEISRFKVDYFKDENILYGSLYKTPEKILTKGRNKGKWLTKWILANKFKPYLELWLKQREELKIDSEWLFIDMYDNGNYSPMKISTLNSWAISFSKILNENFYFHCLRHYFTTHLSRLGLPDSVIKDIVGWESLDLVNTYKDIEPEEEFKKYFDEDGIKKVETTTLKDL